MKPQLSVVLIVLLFIFSSCSKTDIISPQPDTPAMAEARTAIDQTNKRLMSGKWNITSCMNNNIEEKTKFEDYRLSFISNGGISALRDNANLPGNWVTTYVNNQVRLTITFLKQSGGIILPPNFTAVSGDWTILENTERKIKMAAVTNSANSLVIEWK